MSRRIAILISGSGTNMLAIAEAVRSGELDAQITFVGSDKKEAPGLAKAEQLGLAVIFFSYKNGKAAAEKEIAGMVDSTDTDWIVLAGYMRILSADFTGRFAGRIINIHPSLLPAFPGAHAINDAWNYGVKVTGVTIHIVDELVDHGKILAQRAVQIDDGDTLETLEDKIHKTEHQLYKAVLKQLFQDPAKTGGKSLRIGAGETGKPSEKTCGNDYTKGVS